EDWKIVDKSIPKVCNNKSIIGWAFREGLNDGNENVRDLAASILEKTSSSLTKEIKEKLYSRMKKDDNSYVRYRSSFALAAHDPSFHEKDVKAVLQKAKKDPDVSQFAESYLKQYTS
ncbi:MAG: hypothetical protein KJ968_05860, partial [Nanoarchaeota archaeon]|nr:hypothetical protein [Nanoarchaeota archaeon]